jgi:hypothetical protein
MNSVTMHYARQIVGTKIGNWLVKAVIREGESLRMLCECLVSGCGQGNKFTLAQLQAEGRSPRQRCTNWQRHIVAKKPAGPDCRAMNDADFYRWVSDLSSDAYRVYFASDEFKARVNRMPARPKTREEGLANKEAAELQQRRKEAQHIVANLFCATLACNHKMPFDGGIDGWLKLSPQEQTDIKTYYSLDTKNWSVMG